MCSNPSCSFPICKTERSLLYPILMKIFLGGKIFDEVRNRSAKICSENFAFHLKEKNQRILQYNLPTNFDFLFFKQIWHPPYVHLHNLFRLKKRQKISYKWEGMARSAVRRCRWKIGGVILFEKDEKKWNGLLLCLDWLASTESCPYFANIFHFSVCPLEKF